MKKDKQPSLFVNIGSSSLLIIFLVLSLVIFAVLSLVSAHSDYNVSERLAAHKTEYYAACSEAEQIIGGIDDIFEKQAEAFGDHTSSYVEAVVDTLMQGELPAQAGLTYKIPDNTDEKVSYNSDTLLILDFSIPMSKKQALEVTLCVNDYTKTDTYYNIQTWKVVSTQKWENGQSIQLLPMGD